MAELKAIISKLIFIGYLFVSSNSWAKIDGGVLSDSQIKKIQELSQKTLPEQITIIGDQVKLELLKSTRKKPTTYFDSLGQAEKSVEDITDVEGLYGKAVCTKSDETLIYIAEDAPPSTLLHEYIHSLQTKNEPKWCELEGRVLSSDEKRAKAQLYHRFEFEVLSVLWNSREASYFNFEDQLILMEGLRREHPLMKKMGYSGLPPEQFKKLDHELEVIQNKITFLTWLKKSPDDAGTVLQKIEALSLKTCTEQTIGDDETQRLNECLQERCRQAKVSCRPIQQKELKGMTAFQRSIYAWIKPYTDATCTVAKFEQELMDDPEASSECWKKWYKKNARKKDLELSKLTQAQVESKFGVKALKNGSDIQYFEVGQPTSFINNAYCYFIFQKVARLHSLPVNQFAYAALGGSFSTENLKDYRKWLQSTEDGKVCSKLVELFSGEKPSKLAYLENLKKKYALVINPIAALTGGLTHFKGHLKTAIQHEWIHILYATDDKMKTKAIDEWSDLSKEAQDKFMAKHSSYDFTNKDILYREYLSYTYQDQPSELK